MDERRLDKQLRFIQEADKLKAVLRRNLLCDRSRRENSAEHSWHIGLMAALLAEYSPEPIDCLRAIRMALVHDLVEIDAGDTFVYEAGDHKDKEEREARAADRIFALLPADQQGEVLALWKELEQGTTAEARFVRVLDRLQPLLLHQMTGGVVWAEHGVSKDQVLERVDEIRESAPELWPIVCKIIDEAVTSGRLRK